MNNIDISLRTEAIAFRHTGIKNLNNGDNKQTSDKQINSEHHKTKATKVQTKQ